MLAGVEARLNDLTVVLKETHDHRMGFLDDKIKMEPNPDVPNHCSVFMSNEAQASEGNFYFSSNYPNWNFQ